VCASETARIRREHIRKWIAFLRRAVRPRESASGNVLRLTGEVEASVEALPDTAP